MAVDPLSPIAPARIRALLLPAGRIKRTTFSRFVEALQPECNVRLGDVSPDFTPNRNMFSPLAFPSGVLLYDLATTLPTPSQLALSPFELFREPFVIIGIADADEYDFQSANSNGDDSTQQERMPHLVEAIYRLRERFPNALVHQLFVLNHKGASRHESLPVEAAIIPPQAQWKTTTLKTIMCDLSSLLLAEMTAFAKSLQALPTLPSPSSPEFLTAEGNLSNTKTAPVDPNRRNSQMTVSTRSESPTTPTPTGLYRMSMPPNITSSLPGSRPLSPASEPRSPPAKTFDEIPGVNIAEVVARSNSTTSTKSKQPSESRNSSQDRVSVHGFGPGGVLERARNKGIGRVGIAVGSLYLCAGLWPDALRELTEHAINAKNLSDHLWHAKGLENILVCLILLAWRRVDFQIPQICYPNPEKTINLPNIRSQNHTPSNSITSTSGGSPRSSFQIAAVQKLNAAIPDLITMILSIYGRAGNFTGEAMPLKAHSECIIRLSKYLSMSHVAGGSLTDRALESIVCDVPYSSKSNMNISRIAISPTKNEIAAMLLRAVPLPAELTNMSIADGSIILTGIASVLSMLRLDRKRALVMKELISFMIPAIVQARKIGAAEMGVHPAAGLGLMGGGGGATDATRLGATDPATGLLEFLNLLGRIYGVSHGLQTSKLPLNGPRCDQVNGTPVLPPSPDGQGKQRSSVVIERIQNRALIHDFGNLNLKLDILRMCINFCEALPDFKGVMHFTAALLRAAGPGNAPKPDSPDVYVSLAKEEQLRHAATISRTITTARKLGLENLETDYWDDFLVRNIAVVESVDSSVLKKHRRADLEAVKLAEDKRKSPFIHDPFMKSQEQGTETLLVAGDENEFHVTLQNPYEFEVEIEILGLVGEGVEFQAEERDLHLGPFRTQKFSIIGVAKTEGKLSITACSIKIKGCRQQIFPIFVEPWNPEPSLKIKGIGLQASTATPSSRPVSGLSTSSETILPTTTNDPVSMTLSLTVLSRQPLLTVESISLMQSSLMLLEGEKKQFCITVKNISQDTINDFLHLSFEDTTTTSQRNAMTNKDIPRAELHELEIQVARNPPLRWLQADEKSAAYIEPQEKHIFDIEVLGKPGLLEGTVQIDYASIGKELTADHFYTRQVCIPVNFTVNASIQLHRFDIVSFDRNFSLPNTHASSSHPLANPPPATESCMLLLDYRNAWPSPLTITLSVLSPATSSSQDPISASTTATETIQPGHTTRLALLLPKLHLSYPHAAIPSLNPANQRQFVVSSVAANPAAERAAREAFWYRDALLARLRGTWTDGVREGALDTRGIRLTGRMVEALSLEEVDVVMRVLASEEGDEEGNAGVQRLAHSKFRVAPHAFVTLRTTLTNRSAHAIHPLLRLQPSLADLPHGAALDIAKKFAVSGVLQRALGVLKAGESVDVDVGVCAMCSGVFEVGAMVEEVRSWTEIEGEEEKEVDVLEGGILGDVGRRVWYAREGCVIVAREDDD